MRLWYSKRGLGCGDMDIALQQRNTKQKHIYSIILYLTPATKMHSVHFGVPRELKSKARLRTKVSPLAKYK